MQPEVVSDVISSTAVQDVGMDVCANFGDSRLKPSEASFSAVGVVVDPTGVKVRLKFGDPRSNRSRDIRLPHFVMNDDNNENDDAGR